MNQENLAYLMLGAAIPVLLPIILKQASAGGAEADEALEKSKLIKRLVDDIVVPVADTFLDEIKKERAHGPTA